MHSHALLYVQVQHALCVLGHGQHQEYAASATAADTAALVPAVEQAARDEGLASVCFLQRASRACSCCTVHALAELFVQAQSCLDACACIAPAQQAPLRCTSLCTAQAAARRRNARASVQAAAHFDAHAECVALALPTGARLAFAAVRPTAYFPAKFHGGAAQPRTALLLRDAYHAARGERFCAIIVAAGDEASDFVGEGRSAESVEGQVRQALQRALSEPERRAAGGGGDDSDDEFERLLADALSDPDDASASERRDSQSDSEAELIDTDVPSPETQASSSLALQCVLAEQWGRQCAADEPCMDQLELFDGSEHEAVDEGSRLQESSTAGDAPV